LQLIESLATWAPDGVPSAVTIGMFDGLHVGHQALLKILDEAAAARRLRTAVLTFDRPPRLALRGESGDGCITDADEKLELLDELGVEVCALLPASGGVLGMEAETFVSEFLCRQLSARLLVVGYDFRFGKNRTGDIDLLRKMGSAAAGDDRFEVIESPVVTVHGEPVKSTLIRERLHRGETLEAAELLGRPYQVRGPVVEGARRGRQLGFPTANIAPAADKLLPANGVYAGFCAVDGIRWPAAINLGNRPTVDPEGSLRGAPRVLEAHLPGFAGDLYGKRASLEFGMRLRDEQRFAGLEALKQQIQRDVAAASVWTSEHGGRVVAA
jgi:riboflavin kinase / FMN adenylyltransferase